MTGTEIIAYHGWGFDADCWEPLMDLTNDEIAWMNFDRGYFGEPQSPVFSPNKGKKILITHSFGLHQCSDQIMGAADLLIVISGFLTFHPKSAPLERRSKLVVNEMINQFDEQPANVLRAFYRNVFHPEKSYELPPPQMSKSLLQHDLKWLNNSERSVPGLKKSTKICILHGTDDAIVPARKARNLVQQFHDHTQYFELEGAGHALPMTRASECHQIISDAVDNLTY